MVVTYQILNRMRRVVRSAPLLSVEERATRLAALKLLRATYEVEVVCTIPGFEGPRSLAYWSEFFKLAPQLRTPAVRAKLAYARETKVEMDLP